MISNECKLDNNIYPMSIDEYRELLEGQRKVINKKHFSLYITRDGKVIDARGRNNLGHYGYCNYVYENISELQDVINEKGVMVYKSVLLEHNENPSCLEYLKDVLLEKAGMEKKSLDVMDLRRHILSDEDAICHDLGFVKVLVMLNERGRPIHTSVVLPLSEFNGYSFRGAQEDALRKVSELISIETAVKMEEAIREGEEKNKYFRNRIIEAQNIM